MLILLFSKKNFKLYFLYGRYVLFGTAGGLGGGGGGRGGGSKEYGAGSKSKY